MFRYVEGVHHSGSLAGPLFCRRLGFAVITIATPSYVDIPLQVMFFMLCKIQLRTKPVGLNLAFGVGDSWSIILHPKISQDSDAGGWASQHTQGIWLDRVARRNLLSQVDSESCRKTWSGMVRVLWHSRVDSRLTGAKVYRTNLQLQFHVVGETHVLYVASFVFFPNGRTIP